MTPVAQINNTAGTESIVYLYTDPLMTNRLATDQTQTIVWRWEGEAFGNTLVEELAGVQVNLRFPGQYFDQETNLHYNYFRYYDSQLGRYITSDRIGLLGGINTYGYVFQNPIIYTDPTGQALPLVYALFCTAGATGPLLINDDEIGAALGCLGALLGGGVGMSIIKATSPGVAIGRIIGSVAGGASGNLSGVADAMGEPIPVEPLPGMGSLEPTSDENRKLFCLINPDAEICKDDGSDECQ